MEGWLTPPHSPDIGTLDSSPGIPAFGRRGAGLLGALLLAGCAVPPTAHASGSRPPATATGGPLPAGGIAALQFQNAGTETLGAGIAIFGQHFARGEVPAGSGLVASINGGASQPVQMDVKTRHADRSVRMAVLSVARPAIAARRYIDVVLAAAMLPGDEAPVPIEAVLSGHSFTVTMAFREGQAVELDVLSALRTALARGGTAALFWLRGPLVAQARVSLPIAGRSMRLVCDVTAFRDGLLAVDVQFANDRAMEAVGGHVAYTATVTMDGRQMAQVAVNQMQYQTWHRRFLSAGTASGWQDRLGVPIGGWLNIMHDTRKLTGVRAVADYDLTLQVPASVLNAYQVAIQDPAWGTPLAANDVRKYMPDVGGRNDIGITTRSNTVWLLTQAPRAAAYALGQAEAAGAVPWNMWDAAHGTWLNAGDYPQLWIDERGGKGRPGDPASTGLTQQWEWTGYDGWTPETAHQPDLAFIPYLLTGERWILDRLQAQAAWNTVANWPSGERIDGPIKGLVVRNVQPRGAAWALRTLENAVWATPESSPERAYFRAVADTNWAWLVSQIPEWTALEGEAHGYLPNLLHDREGRVSPWEQDYFAAVAVLAAARGIRDALTFVKWMENFLAGRFEQAAGAFNARDGVAETIQVAGSTGDARGVPYKTWAKIGAATVANDLSNTDPAHSASGWKRSEGYYGQLALSSLAGIYKLTGSSRAKAAYELVVRLNPPFISKAAFEEKPNFAVTIPGLYGRG